MRPYLVFFVSLLFWGIASADSTIPQDVLVPYNDYNHSLEAKDYVSAKKHAYAAWQAAEKHLGDHKSTGDLAMNFAALPASTSPEDRMQDYKRRVKAIKRGIKLARFYNDDAGLIEVQRRIDLIDLQLTFSERMITVSVGAVYDKTRYGKISELKKLEKAVQKHGLQNTTFDGDMHTLFARYYQLNQRHKPALEYADKAIEIFQSRTDDYASPYAYLAYTYKGNIHKELAYKNEDASELINAALAYKSVVDNKIGDLPDTHVFIATARVRCLSVIQDIEKAGRLDDAISAGVRDC